MLTGSNGILNTALKAKEETEKASEKEQILIGYTEAQMYNLNTSVSAEELLKQLNNDKVDVLSVYGSSLLIVVMKNGNIYEIDNNGNINFVGTQVSFSDEEPIMMAREDEYAFWQEEYRTKITKIETKPYIVKLENIVEEFDVSQEQNNSVMAYMLDDGSDGYELYIMADGEIEFNSNCEHLFSKFTTLETLNLQNVDTTNVTTMRNMFSQCTNLTNVDVSNFVTDNVVDMGYLFRGDSSLISLDLSNFNTSKVINMEYMFHTNSNLINLDLSNFDTSKVWNMNLMFAYCYNLTTLDVSSFDTSKLKAMSMMFYGCHSLIALDVSNFDTSNITSMSYVFGSCKNLTKIDVTSWNVNGVTDMSYMFSQCDKLKELDLSNWNTNAATNVKLMFAECKSLTTIYVSRFDETTQKGWIINSAAASELMFSLCTNLMGGLETPWTNEYVDATYAHIDEIGNPGYLTEK